MADTNNQNSFLDYAGLSLFWSKIKKIIEDNELVTATTLTNLDSRVEILEGSATRQMISMTYLELKALRDANSLVPGQQYRITDYVCTTKEPGTRAENHQFDIIVTAASENKLHEEASVIQHQDDTYFANCSLSAWKIWYCLDNDTSRFIWADNTKTNDIPNGRGVIYRMIDEWHNDVPYDFKNIQFSKELSIIAPDSGLTGTTWCYTFSLFIEGFGGDCIASDESVKAKEYIELDGVGCFMDNVIRAHKDELGISFLNSIVFVTDWTHYCIVHHSNTFGADCSLNTFGAASHSNTFGNGCSLNTFGNGCSANTFGNVCSYNTFGNYCSYNSLGNNCISIKFASNEAASTKYSYYHNNHFGDGCQYIVLKGEGDADNTHKVQNYKFAQGTSGTSSSYLTIDGVRNRSFETKVAKNSNGVLKIYCEADLIK